MCGRFTLTQPAYIAAKFGLDNFAPVEPEFYEPRFNVAPTQRIVVIPTVDNQREARRAVGPDPVLGEGYEDRLEPDQRQGREHRYQACVPQPVQVAPLPD